MSEHTTGTPEAIASSGGSPNPSAKEGKTNAFAPENSRTMSSSVGSGISINRSFNRGSVFHRSTMSGVEYRLPAITSFNSGKSSSSRRNARMTPSTFLWAIRRPR